MAISAEQLNIILSAKDKEFTRAMDRSQKRVERFAKTSNKSLGETSQAFNKLGGAVTAVVAAMSAGALVSSLKQVVQKLDDIGKTADQIGITTDALQELRTVAESSGVTQDELDKSIEKLGKGLAEAAMGLGTAKDGLKTLGLSAEYLMDLGLEGALGVIADELNKLPSPMQKTATATQLFGRSGAPMVNLLREGSAGMANMRREARELGVVIDEVLIRSAEESQDKLDLLARVIDADVSSAMIKLAPLLTTVSGLMADLAGGAGNAFVAFQQLFSSEMLAGTKSRLTGELIEELAEAEAALENVSKKRTELLAKAKGADGLTDFNLLSDREINRLTMYQIELQRLQATLEGLRAQQEALNSPADEGVIGTGQTPEETSGWHKSSMDQKTKALLEQARLRSIGAEAAERERIATEKQALIQAVVGPYFKEGIPPEVVKEAERLGAEFEAAAIAASSILNPIKQIPPVIADTRTELEKMIEKMLEASPALVDLGFDAEKLHSVMQTVESSMESAFMSMVDGTMSAKDAFKSMAADIIKQLYKVLVVEQMVSSISGAIKGAFGAPSGGGGGKASGGTVQAGRPYVTGEHGRELFVPSSAGRVLSVAQSKAAVGGGDSVIVNQTINVTTGVQQTVRAEIMGLMPQIQNASKAAVLDAKRRGGAFAGAF